LLFNNLPFYFIYRFGFESNSTCRRKECAMLMPQNKYPAGGTTKEIILLAKKIVVVLDFVF